MKIVSVEEMIQLEKDANDRGVSYSVMMMNAGNGIASWLKNNLSLKHGMAGLVGSGNNGGDTLIALTNLAHHNVRTFAFLVRQRPADPLIQEYKKVGGVVIDISENNNLSLLKALLSQNTILLDGMLGTGFKLPLRENLAAVMGNIHTLVNNLPKARIIAVDCPSGIDCDSGKVSQETLRAETTLTLAAIKQGLLKYPAREYSGDIHGIEIGIPIDELTKGQDLPVLIDRKLVSHHLPLRPETGHKGTFGTCLIVAGTEAFTGAAYLAGKAAYRSGCGLVNLATKGFVRNALAGKLIEAIWTVLPNNDGGYDPRDVEAIEPALSKADALVIGPGWGLNKTNVYFLEKLLKAIPKELPTIIDADGLKLLTQINDWWAKLPVNTVLTPHSGEMSVLTNLEIAEIEDNRWETTKLYAQKWGVTLVLKGAITVICSPQGQLYINPVGDSALATAGSGDVLSGIIGGLMAQGMASEYGAILGVWVHGKAGQFAHKEIGTAAGVTAVDILEQVGKEIPCR